MVVQKLDDVSSCLFKKLNLNVSNNFVFVPVSALNFICDIGGENVLSLFTLFLAFIKHAYYASRSTQ
jgi:hypothetical protein